MEYNEKNFYEFPATPEGLQEAIEWSKTQPHSERPNLTLYDEVYRLHEDGFTTIHKINEAKRKLFKNQ